MCRATLLVFSTLLLLPVLGGLLAAPRPSGVERPLSREEQARRDGLQALRSVVANPKATPEEVWQQAQYFNVLYPGTSECVAAAALLSTVRSPLDQLQRSAIAEEERLPWMPADVVAVLGEQRGRHWAEVDAVSCTPDGKQILSVGGDGLRMFDAITLREQQFIPEVKTFALSPDGKILAVVVIHDDPNVLIPDGRFRSEVRLLTWREGQWKVKTSGITKTHRVWHLSFSPDQRTLVSGGENISYIPKKGFDVRRKRLTWDLTGERPTVTGGVYLPKDGGVWSQLALNGKWLIDNGAPERRVRIWNMSEAVPQLHEKLDGFVAGAVSPDGRTLALCEAKAFGIRGIRLWKATEKGISPFLDVSGDFTRSPAMAFAPDNDLLVAVSGKRLVLCPLTEARRRELRLKKGQQTHTTELPFPASGVCCLPDRKTVVLASGNTVRLWNLGLSKEKAELYGNRGKVWSLAFSPDARSLVYCGRHVPLRWWDLTGRKPKEYRGSPWTGFWADSLAFSADGKILAGEYWLEEDEDCPPNVRLALWKLGSTREQTPTLSSLQDHLIGFQFACGGSMLYSTGREAVNKDEKRRDFGRLWTLKRGAPEARFVFPLEDPERDSLLYDELRDHRLSADGRYLAYRIWHTIHLWDLSGATPRKLGSVEHRRWEHPMDTFALSPDGRILAGGSQSSLIVAEKGWPVVKFWDISKRLEPLGSLVDGTTDYWVESLTFSPDGRFLGLIGGNGLCTIWDFVARKKIREWRLPATPAMMAFAPDSRHVATANPNGTVYIFRLRENSR